MTFIDDFIHFLGGGLHQACNPTGAGTPCIPYSTLVIAVVSLSLSLVSMSASRFLVDYKMIIRTRQEYMTFMKAMNKARKDGDQKQLDKLMKKSPAMNKMQLRATGEQFKTTAITLVPFWIIYGILGYALTSPAAYAPFIFPFGSNISFFIWYALCSLTFSIPLSRIFGVASAYSMANPTGGVGDTK